MLELQEIDVSPEDLDYGSISLNEDSTLIDLLTGEPISDTPVEQFRQYLLRSLLVELGIDKSRVCRDLSIRVNKKILRLSLVVFLPDTHFDISNATHIVVIAPTPKSKRPDWLSIERIERDIESLRVAMLSAPNCHYGLWTNQTDYLFFKKRIGLSGIELEQVAGWTDTPSGLQLPRNPTDPDSLRHTFELALNILYAHEGLSSSETFWQFLYLLVCKQFDELRPRSQQTFIINPTAPYSAAGQQQIRDRLETLFSEVQQKYSRWFPQPEGFKLSNHGLAHLAGLFSRLHLNGMQADVKGAVYQTVMGAAVRGDRGQFFTPRGVVAMAVQMIAPLPHEAILDPSCGTGGFLSAVLHYWDQRSTFVDDAPFITGIEIDYQVARAAEWNLLINGVKEPRILRHNALDPEIFTQVPDESQDVIFSNPPFGIGLAVKAPDILERFQLAHIWKKQGKNTFIQSDAIQKSVVPEVLFIEQACRWLKPGGRMAIILPNGFLSNSSFEYARHWLIERCWILASISIPVEAFLVEADVSINTGLLLLQKKTVEELQLEAQYGTPDYSIFMAVAEKIGFDRRGKPIYKRDAEGVEIFCDRSLTYLTDVDGEHQKRTLTWKDRIRDDDFPTITHLYHEVRAQTLLPGQMLLQKFEQDQMQSAHRSTTQLA